MTPLRSSPNFLVTVQSAGRKAHWKSTTSKVDQPGSTSEKTLSDSVLGATTNCTPCPAKAACRKGKCSQPSDSWILRFTVPRRWPAYVAVLVLATVLSACRIGYLIGDAAIQLLLNGRIR